MMRWGTKLLKMATEPPPSAHHQPQQKPVSGARAAVPTLVLAPGTFCEAGVRIQVFLGLLHWGFFYFRFDIDGASFRGASIIQFLESQRKGSSTTSAAILPLHADCSISGTDEGPASILCNSYYKLIIIQFQRCKQLPEGPQNLSGLGRTQ